MPKKTLAMLEDEVTAAELLDEYEHHLDFFLKWMHKYGRCDYEETDIVLFIREDLWESLKCNPNGLTKEERRRLRDLDKVLKANAKLIAKALPELPQIRQRLKPPRSHWWWYLDRLAQRQQVRKGEKMTIRGGVSRK